MTDIFVYGALCHAPLLRVVLGEDAAAGTPAALPGYAVHRAGRFALPHLVARPGAQTPGRLLCGLSAQALARLEFYAQCHAQVAAAGFVLAGQHKVMARFHTAPDADSDASPPWHPADWPPQDAETLVALAADVMALHGCCTPQDVGTRLGPMLVRGGSRLRAGSAPAALPGSTGLAGGVVVAAARQPYARFFAIEEYDLAYRRFDGNLSPAVTRAVFVSGDAITVLPYDPLRDRVLLIEQFRAGPFARGDAQTWQFEAIAGRIDPGETPQDCARREAAEEAGLTLHTLLPVAQYYPSPGAMTEYLYSYLALVDLPDTAAGVFGVAGEAEDIRGHLVGFDALMAMIDEGRIANAPLILTALWLQRARPGLR